MDTSLLLCQPCNHDVDDGSLLPNIRVDAIHNNETKEQIGAWLQSLTSVMTSDSYWLNDVEGGIFSAANNSSNDDSSGTSSDTSISDIVQRLFDSLHITTATNSTATAETDVVGEASSSTTSTLHLFATNKDKETFNTNFRKACQSINDNLYDEIVSTGTSNNHPLKIQFLACPPNFNFKLHSHPNVELCIPLVGELYERRLIGTTLHPSVVARPMNLSSALSVKMTKDKGEDAEDGGKMEDKEKKKKYHYNNPTDTEIKQVYDSIQNIMKQKVTTLGNHGRFVTRKLEEGHVLFNNIGTIHQSYTKRGDDNAKGGGGCLLLAIWSGFHGDIGKECNCFNIQGSELLVL